MNKSRNQEINLLKFIAIICVILIHDKLPGNAGAIIRAMAAMAVPVFFMISGYYSYEASGQVLGKRVKRTFFLMIIANVLYFVWDVWVEILSGNSLHIWFAENCSIKRIAVWVLTNESSLRGHLWFLGALLYAYMFLFLLIKWHELGKLPDFLWEKKDKWLAMLAGVLILGNIVGGEVLTQLGRNIQIPYIRNWLFCGIPFLLIGYCLCGYLRKNEIKSSGFKLGIGLLAVLVLNLVEVIFMEASELYLTTVLVAILSFVLAVRGEGKVRNKLLIKAGNIADKYGLWIYILQIMVIKTIQWFESEMGWTDNLVAQCLSPVLSFVLTVLVAIIPVWLSDLRKRRK
ncbi:MAG: acyltransferase [Lachnospiraceae bacterium]|nr:acyltransferase [Lachnospiraceae bacterium]